MPLDESTAGPAKDIQAIDKSSVHRICSGQVVLNIATAVKELVENSIDAGATNIEIRLKDHGSELVEVIDNGNGVEAENFAGLTLKHHTSKLKDFSDLVNVDTFGFRGEALSSLCALSNMTIVTCHKDCSVGTRLEFDHHGKIVKEAAHPRQKGTTVILEKLFSTLPVRHKEFLRNLKREFTKAVQVLNAYCIVSTGVRITCSNQIGKGKKNIVVSTGGNPGVLENITNIFGAKQSQNLLCLRQLAATGEICVEFGIKERDRCKNLFHVSGYISTSEHGHGRSSADRQFYFINRRPCDPQKISRVVNETYHMYNRHQYPFVMLDVSLGKDSVDVNVTPDKRQIFVQEERLLLAIIKSSLVKVFDSCSGLYRVNKAILKNKIEKKPDSLNISSFLSSHPSGDASRLGSCGKMGDVNVESGSHASGESGAHGNSLTSDDPVTIPLINGEPGESRDEDSGICVPGNDVQLIPDVSTSTLLRQQSTGGNRMSTTTHLHKKAKLTTSPSHISRKTSGTSLQLKCLQHFRRGSLHGEELDKLNDDMDTSAVCSGLSDYKDGTSPGCKGNRESRMHSVDDNMSSSKIEQGGKDQDQTDDDVQITFTEYDSASDIKRKEQKCKFSMSDLQLSLQKKKSGSAENKRQFRNFRAQINPSDNDAAENELQKEISRDMFSKMEILGQFNLGFIISQLGRDLFIIDQHASDEKFNFEELQKHTVIQSQKLIQPQCLELTAANECILLDNLNIFHANGFHFTVNENALPTQRLHLVSMPVSKDWTFGKDDIEELIFMLSDSPGVMCRPSRIRAMFASRACRKSVMIGTALSKPDMKKLVGHMGELDQPWNCPHGRPTMRHLINLDMLPD